MFYQQNIILYSNSDPVVLKSVKLSNLLFIINWLTFFRTGK